MRKKRILLVPALLACILLIAPIMARAGSFDGTDMQVMISSGADSITLDDGGTGEIIFNQKNIGVWNINEGTAHGSDGLLTLPQLLDLNSFDATNSGGGTGTNALTLKLTLTGLTGQQLLGVMQAIGGTNNANNNGLVTVTQQAFYSSTNSAFCTSGCSALTSLVSASTNGFTSYHTSGNGSLGASTSNPYSLTMVITISSAEADSSSFDGGLNMIPEPATLSVMGAGLLAFGTGLRKRMLRA